MHPGKLLRSSVLELEEEGGKQEVSADKAYIVLLFCSELCCDGQCYLVFGLGTQLRDYDLCN